MSSTGMPRCFGPPGVCMQTSLVCKGLSHPCLPLSRCSSWASTLCWCQLRLCRLVQHQLAWGAWQGTAGTRAGVSNSQWSPSSLASQSLHSVPTTHLLPGWFGLLKWCWEYLGITYLLSVGVPAFAGVSHRTCRSAAVNSRRVEYYSNKGNRSWWPKWRVWLRYQGVNEFSPLQN